MCGIVGRINFDGNSIEQNTLVSASELMHERGPDDKGIWIEKNCGFAHTRLSILDLSSAGSQPMISSNSRYVIVFNGEIYNCLELREDLGGKNFNWKGHSDTEILLEGWSRWGIDLLDKIDGMFAFAIWDRKLQKLTAARDRMGEKPFYYHWDGKIFGFCSRPKPLFKVLPHLSSEYDDQALRYYLESGYVPAPYSIHKAVRKLPAAHYLEVSKNDLKIESYWDPSKIETKISWVKRNQNDLLDELDEILLSTVKQRMISDVPIGAFLSGGIDSSLIVAMMSKINNDPIKTFTIGFKEKAYDESQHAQKVAEHLVTDHYCEDLKVNDLLDLLPSFLHHYDEPFFDSAAFPTLAVSRLASKHIKVNLTGDGGDELFGGYHYYRIAKVLNPFFMLPNGLRNCVSLFSGLIPQHQFKLLSKAIGESNAARSFAFTRSIAKDFRQLLSKDVLNKTDSLADLFENTSEQFPSNLHACEQAMRLDATYTMNDDYLQKTDVATMAYSLEARAPMLGRKVVEWGMKLPTKWKIRGLTNKYLLRKLAYRYIPRQIIDRPKRGFGVPIDDWLRGPLSGWAFERLNNSDYFKGIPINQSAAKSLFQLHQSGRREVHPLLWAILMLLEFNKRLQ